MQELNLDQAGILPITIPEDHSYVISIKIKDKVTGIYQPFSGVWKLVVARDEEGLDVVETLLEGNGFTLSNDLLTMTIDIPTVRNLITTGSYFYDIRGDEGGYSKHPLKGRFKVNPVVGKP